ncbi:Hypothetical predicted protein [Paramuricea clavata]|uniref:Uncharacterized protein n=1 Tax=Paramuricea clavata TaxID=317549 RepID=A0A6S7G5C4_PARCT|nr:Hypothetical predicted protein [Paramuricea clavata]
MSKSKQVSSKDSGNTLAAILKELKGFREESSIMVAKVKEIKSAVNDLRASVEYTQAEVNSIKVDLCNTKTELAEVKVTNSSLTSDVESLKYKVLELECYSRSYNIRIGGIMEAHGKSCMDHVFFSRPLKNEVLRLAKRNKSIQSSIYFLDELTKEDLDLKQHAHPLMAAAYKEGSKVAFRAGRLIINGTVTPIPT